ncbi:unnamed protein product [Ilex paraguariensis]|uniref:SPT2 chromatin protein n=1 Tax=Ilex paraguariensis TaxID=185542 RepID=A0ABC8S476_9AQUA
MGTPKLTSGLKVNVKSVDSRKQLGSNNDSGPGRPLGSKELPFPRVSSNGSGAGRPLGPKLLPSKIPAATTEKKSSAPNAKRSMSSVNGSGAGRPLGPKLLPSKIPAATTEKKSSAPNAKRSMSSVYKSSLLKLQSSKQPVVQQKKFQEPSKGKIMPKPPVSASKSQQCGDLLCRYNPNKYPDDDDDSDMEAGFDDILREEKRSAMIAKREDEEELLKIEEEEEERRERLRKETKRRKLS